MEYKVVNYSQDTILMHTGQADFSYGVYRKGANRPVCLCRSENRAYIIAAALEKLEADLDQINPQGTQDKRSPEPGWLKKQFDEVEKEVDKWPDWKKGESPEKKDEARTD